MLLFVWSIWHWMVFIMKNIILKCWLFKYIVKTDKHFIPLRTPVLGWNLLRSVSGLAQVQVDPERCLEAWKWKGYWLCHCHRCYPFQAVISLLPWSPPYISPHPIPLLSASLYHHPTQCWLTGTRRHPGTAVVLLAVVAWSLQTACHLLLQ